MEKIYFYNKQGLKLVGDLYAASAEAIIVLCHAFTWDRHDGGRFDQLAQSLREAGYSVLTFDFGGNGESDDDTVTVKKYADDFISALDFAQKRGFAKIGAAGRSLGCLAEAVAADPRIQTFVWWAPDIYKRESFLDRFSPEQKAELKEKGFFTHPTPQPNSRPYIRIAREFIAERESVDQKSILQKIKVPVLIIQGDRDSVVPLKESREAMQYLPAGSRLEIIPGAEHRFGESLAAAIKLTAGWFNDHLRAS